MATKRNSDSPATLLSVEVLKAETSLTDEQLETVIEPQDFSQLAELFHDCCDLLDEKEFNLSNSDKVNIKRCDSNQERVHLLLQTWTRTSQSPNKCTFRVLINILLRLKQSDVALEVAKYLNSRLLEGEYYSNIKKICPCNTP